MSLFTPYDIYIRENFRLINKQSERVMFEPNAIQAKYIEQATGRDIILKARQQGFSSLILAIFATDFLLKRDIHSVVVADEQDNAIGLLDRVKLYFEEFQDINKQKLRLKYDSRYELVNEENGCRYTIGTAQNVQFGRSKTIGNLHLSEAAFYRYLLKIMAGAGSAVVPTGRFIIETTANGFNEFKTFWDQSVMGETGFKPLFFPAQDFYSPEFLRAEFKRLGERLYMQEYPDSPESAFIASGETYFDNLALKHHLEEVKNWEQRNAILSV